MLTEIIPFTNTHTEHKLSSFLLPSFIKMFATSHARTNWSQLLPNGHHMVPAVLQGDLLRMCSFPYWIVPAQFLRACAFAVVPRNYLQWSHGTIILFSDVFFGSQGRHTLVPVYNLCNTFQPILIHIKFSDWLWIFTVSATDTIKTCDIAPPFQKNRRGIEGYSLFWSKQNYRKRVFRVHNPGSSNVSLSGFFTIKR